MLEDPRDTVRPYAACMAPAGRAVVVGASMGGLLAARALSDTYPEVLLLDRDALPAAPASLIAYDMSRPLLEHVVRERVTTLPGVRVLAGHEVTGLLTTPDRRRVVGVQVAAGAAAHPEPGAAGAARPARRLRHGTAPSGLAPMS